MSNGESMNWQPGDCALICNLTHPQWSAYNGVECVIIAGPQPTKNGEPLYQIDPMMRLERHKGVKVVRASPQYLRPLPGDNEPGSWEALKDIWVPGARKQTFIPTPESMEYDEASQAYKMKLPPGVVELTEFERESHARHRYKKWVEGVGWLYW